MTDPRDQYDDPTDDQQSFDAFWSELKQERGTRTKYENILGVQVPIPTTMPLSFAFQLEDLKDSESMEDFRRLVSELFGGRVFEQLLDAGVDEEQMLVILGWGMAHAKGTPITFRAAHELMQRSGQGNEQAANRSDRRAAQRERSATGGGRSNRTSAGSTSSRQRRSRR